jgi:lysophospholipase L1-like esterase
MKRREFLGTIAAPAIAVALQACGRRGPRLPRLDGDGVILAFGDSLTFGTGASPDESYPAVLAKLISRKVIRSGVPGETAEEGFKRLPEVLDESSPQLVIHCEGGNDLLRRAEDSAVKESLRKSLTLIRGRGTSLVLMAPPRPAILSGSPPFYAELSSEFRIPLEAEILKTVLTDNKLKSDPIHPNARGYAKIADALAKLLKDAGAL